MSEWSTGRLLLRSRRAFAVLSAGILVTAIGSVFGGVRAADSSSRDSAPVATETTSSALSQLRQGDYAALDAAFNGLQQDYDRGVKNDVDLLFGYRVFYRPDPDLRRQYEAWVAAYPKSYAAHLARGIYLKYLGKKVRGDGYVDQVPPDKLAEMRSVFTLATEELEASGRLTRRPLLTYLHLIDIGKHGAWGMGVYGGLFDALAQYVKAKWDYNLPGRSEDRHLLDEAIQVDPGNFIVRQKYMISLESRWGHSTQEMQWFYDECAQSRLSAEQLRGLSALVTVDRGWNAAQAGDARRAVDYYIEALATAGESVRLWEAGIYAGVLTDIIAGYEKLHDYRNSLAYADKVLATDPDPDAAGDAWARRGVALFQLNDPEGGLAAYQKAAELGVAWVQTDLGKMYWHGHVYRRTGIIQPDRARAIQYFESAAKKGWQPAVEALNAAKKEM